MWFFSFRGPSDDFARFIYGSDMDDLIYERKTRQHYGAKVSRIRKHNGKITDKTRLPVGRMT